MAFTTTIAIVLCADVAHAQREKSDSARTRDERRQSERASAADTAQRLAPIEIRTSILPAASLSIGSPIPARTAVLSSRKVADWKPRLLADLLATQPSISLYDDLGTPWKMNVSARGFTVGPTVGQAVGVTVFVDGVRQNEPDAQEVNFDLLPLEHVARIEVLSGNASLLGPNSLGGAINVITKRGLGPPSGELSLTAGSYGRLSGDTHFGGRTVAGLDYSLGGGIERESGWREATGAHRYNILMNLGHVDGERGVTLQGYAARSRAETAGSVPESEFNESPRTNFTPGDFEDLNAQQVALTGVSPLWGGAGTVGIHVRRSFAERFNVNQAPDPNVRSQTSNLSLGATAEWRASLASLGAGPLSLRVGGDARLNRVRARIFSEDALSSAPSTSSRSLTTDVESPGGDVAGFVLAEYVIRRLTLSGGGRFDFVSVPFKNRVNRDDETQNTFRQMSPRFGASLQIAPGISAYASAGQSFRAPAILELGCADPTAACALPFALGDDPPLRPVRATTLEVGGQLARSSWVASLTMYRSSVRDEIFFVASDSALLSGYFTNLDRTRREGVEVAVQGGVGPRATWYANYAWTRATFQSDGELFSVRSDAELGSALFGENIVRRGSRMPLVPEHQVKGGGDVRVSRALSVGMDWRWTGGQWLRGDEANETTPMRSYSVVGLRAGYRLRGWEVSTIVNNLADSHAATFGTFNLNRRTDEVERFFTPMNAREVRVVVRRFFGRVDGAVGAVDE